jgi:hypothetical protein
LAAFCIICIGGRHAPIRPSYCQRLMKFPRKKGENLHFFTNPPCMGAADSGRKKLPLGDEQNLSKATQPRFDEQPGEEKPSSGQPISPPRDEKKGGSH